MNGYMTDKKLMEINSQVFSEILKFKIWAEIAYSMGTQWFKWGFYVE